MAFLDETGLGELWSLIKAEDAKGAKIATVSYAGTETYGKDNPNSVTFDFAPDFVMFTGYTLNEKWYQIDKYTGTNTYRYTRMIDMSVMPTSYTQGYGFGYDNNPYGKKSEDGKTISWYQHGVGATAQYQYNTSGIVHYLMAIKIGG